MNECALLTAICLYGIIAIKLNIPATLLSREVEGTALRSLGNQAGTRLWRVWALVSTSIKQLGPVKVPIPAESCSGR
jgi:hypothetical protein